MAVPYGQRRCYRRFIADPVKETAATGWFTIEQISDLRLLPGISRWVDERITPSAS